MSATESDRNRWIALYVLCAGVLMIVLDVQSDPATAVGLCGAHRYLSFVVGV